MTDIVYVANDNYIELVGLKNGADNSYVNNATVSVTVTDAAGDNVAGETWPLTMTYEAASNGRYRSILQNSLPLVAGRRYTAIITADGAGLQARWEFELQAQLRT